MKRLFVCTAVLLGLLVSGPALADSPKCINVDKASKKDLTGLALVAEKRAKAIIDYRAKMRTEATKAKRTKFNFNNWATLMKAPLAPEPEPTWKGTWKKICEKNIGKVCFGENDRLQKACPK